MMMIPESLCLCVLIAKWTSGGIVGQSMEENIFLQKVPCLACFYPPLKLVICIPRFAMEVAADGCRDTSVAAEAKEKHCGGQDFHMPQTKPVWHARMILRGQRL